MVYVLKSENGYLKISTIKSLNWTFGVTASSSSLKKIGRTYLQIKLVLFDRDGGGENGEREVLFEMDVKGFYELIGEMERARAVIGVVEEE